MNAEQAKELGQLELWQELVKEIDARIATETYNLLHCQPENLNKQQQRILAMQELVRMPQDIIDRES